MGAPTPTESWYDRFRKREDTRSFYIALAVSGAFHLSMVTVFSVVIYFPREDTAYYDFEIVPLSTPAVQAAPEGDSPPAPQTDGLGGEKLALRVGESGGVALPPLELPTLEFAELERLRVRQEGAQSLSRYDDIFKEAPGDSWARFSRGLSGMSRSLSQLKLSGDESDESKSILDGPGAAAAAPIAHRPAEGFVAYLVWSTEPRDRKLLFAPPIEALWSVDADAVQRPIELILQVSALGRVVNVFSPSIADRELVDAMQMTALRYRFEPLDLDDNARQTATLRIQRDDSLVAP